MFNKLLDLEMEKKLLADELERNIKKFIIDNIRKDLDLYTEYRLNNLEVYVKYIDYVVEVTVAGEFDYVRFESEIISKVVKEFGLELESRNVTMDAKGVLLFVEWVL